MLHFKHSFSENGEVSQHFYLNSAPCKRHFRFSNASALHVNSDGIVTFQDGRIGKIRQLQIKARITNIPDNVRYPVSKDWLRQLCEPTTPPAYGNWIAVTDHSRVYEWPSMRHLWEDYEPGRHFCGAHRWNHQLAIGTSDARIGVIDLNTATLSVPFFKVELQNIKSKNISVQIINLSGPVLAIAAPPKWISIFWDVYSQDRSPTSILMGARVNSLISDGPSRTVFFGDISGTVGAISQGNPPVLRKRKVSNFEVTYLGFSNYKLHILTCNGEYIQINTDLETGKLTWKFKEFDFLRALDPTHEFLLALVAGVNVVYHLPTRQVIASLDQAAPNPRRVLKFIAKPEINIVWHKGNTIEDVIIDSRSPLIRTSLRSGENYYACLFHKISNLFIFGGEDGLIRGVSAADWDSVNVYGQLSGGFPIGCMTSYGQFLFVGGSKTTIKIFRWTENNTYEECLDFTACIQENITDQRILALAFSGKRLNGSLSSGCWFDAEFDGKSLSHVRVRGSVKLIFTLKWIGDRGLFAGASDGCLGYLDWESNSWKWTVTGHGRSLNTIIEIPGTQDLLTGGDDHHLRVWRKDEMFEWVEFKHFESGHCSTVKQLLVNPQTGVVFSVSRSSHY